MRDAAREERVVKWASAESFGVVAKWQGRSLQNSDRRFESARRLPVSWQRPRTAPALAGVVVLLTALLIGACSGPERRNQDATPTTAAMATATVLPSPTPPPAATPTMPVPTATVPPTATSTPSPTATPPPTATPAPEPTPADQTLGLPDVDAHYQLDITSIDVASGIVEADETITIREFRGAVPEALYLQVVPAWDGFFTLGSLSAQGRLLDPEVRNDGVTLVVGIPEDPSTPFVIELSFRLDVGFEASGWGGTSRDGQVLRLGYWFPVISTDHPFSPTLDPSYTAAATFDVTLAIDSGVQFAHTGEITGREDLADGRVRYAMHAGDVRDFALILSAAYSVDTATSAGGVTIELYTVDAAEGERQTILAAAADALDQLAALLGPYPYTTYRIADAGPSMPGGVEFPMLIYINPAYAPLDRLIYHETAHQWLYGILGTRTLLDGWIDEGGAEFFERGLPTGFSEVPDVPAGGYRYPIDATAFEMSGEDRQWYYSIYEQGARFWYQVAWEMGWDGFWAAWRDVYAADAFGIVTPWELLSTWQRHSATDLRPLFDDAFRYDWIDQLPPPGG